MTELIVALDYSKADQALKLVDELKELNVVYKVGFELFMAEGPSFVRELTHKKARVFLDLKFHDIPNTVMRAAKNAASLRVEMFTVHMAGGREMIASIKKEFDNLPSLRPKILGVTVLTSFDDGSWSEVSGAIGGHRGVAIRPSVEGMLRLAASYGVDGVVCSARELPLVKTEAPTLYTVVPGIRPAGSDAGDQARVVTPEDAVKHGASAIVVGRPITQASDPRAVVTQILSVCG